MAPGPILPDPSATKTRQKRKIPHQKKQKTKNKKRRAEQQTTKSSTSFCLFRQGLRGRCPREKPFARATRTVKRSGPSRHYGKAGEEFERTLRKAAEESKLILEKKSKNFNIQGRDEKISQDFLPSQSNLFAGTGRKKYCACPNSL